jgi:hypothetical protein
MKSSSALIRRLSAGGESASSDAAAFAEPSFAMRTKASSERKGGNRRMEEISLILCSAERQAFTRSFPHMFGFSCYMTINCIAKTATGIFSFALAQFFREAH